MVVVSAVSLLSVVGTNRHACSLYGGLPVKAESGYLMPRGTTSARPSAAGTASCPWLIRARPGQRVNLTLFNLDRQQSTLSVSAAGVRRRHHYWRRRANLSANSHRHTRHDKTAAPAGRPPPRRRPGRQLRLAARPPTRSDVVRRAECKHAVDCCIRLNLNYFTRRHATTMTYRLTVQTLPDGLQTQFTATPTALSCRVGRLV